MGLHSIRKYKIHQELYIWPQADPLLWLALLWLLPLQHKWLKHPKSTAFDLFGVPLTLYCTPDGNGGIFGFAAPFRGANVQLQCGNRDIIVNATTDSFGTTYLVTQASPFSRFFPVESNCKLIVKTTLSTCNPGLPSIGGLVLPLGFVGIQPFRNLRVANYAPTGFRFSPHL